VLPTQPVPLEPLTSPVTLSYLRNERCRHPLLGLTNPDACSSTAGQLACCQIPNLYPPELLTLAQNAMGLRNGRCRHPLLGLLTLTLASTEQSACQFPNPYPELLTLTCNVGGLQ
jgi:hypothetical protein